MARYALFVVAAGLLVGVWAVPGPKFFVRAEEACLAAPTGAAPEGEHWYYRTDTAKQIKCWHLAAKSDPALAPQLAPRVMPESRSSAAKPNAERTQARLGVHGGARSVASQPHAPEHGNSVPFPKPAPSRQRIVPERIGPAETSGPQGSSTTKTEGTTFSAADATAGATSSPFAFPLRTSWPNPVASGDNGTAPSPPPPPEPPLQAIPPSKSAEAPEQAQSPPIVTVQPLNTVTAPKEREATGIIREEHLQSEATASHPKTSAPAPDLGRAEPLGDEEGAPSNLMKTVIAIITAATNTYSETVKSHFTIIATALLWLFVFALIIGAAFFHRLLNRVRVLALHGAEAGQRLK